MPRHATWEFVDDVCVFSMRSGPVDPDEFDQSLVDIERERPRVMLVLQVEPGTVTMGATRRQRITDMMKRRGTRQVVVTDNVASRGIVAAIRWLGSDIRAFAWSKLDDALRHVGAESRASRRLLQAAIERGRLALLGPRLTDAPTH